jgi:hypothetical protein
MLINNTEIKKISTISCNHLQDEIEAVEALLKSLQSEMIRRDQLVTGKPSNFSMTNHFDYFDKTVQECKRKVYQREPKYAHSPKYSTPEALRIHLIEEIFEFFKVDPTIKVLFYDSLPDDLTDESFDIPELIDIINLCWMYKWSVENKNPINTRVPL